MSKSSDNSITGYDRSIIKAYKASDPISALSKSVTDDDDKLKKAIESMIALFKELGATLDAASKKVKQTSETLETDSKSNKSTFRQVVDANWESLKNTIIKPKDGGLDAISSAFKGLSEIFESDKATANLMKWAQGFADVGKNILSGKPVDALIGIGKTIGSMLSANRQANKEIAKYKEELVRAAISYSIKAIAATKDIKSGKDSIFSTDQTNKLSKGMTGYNDAQIMLKEREKNLNSEEVQTGIKKRKFLGITTGTKTYWGDFKSNYKKIIDTDKELIDANGKLDMSVANSLLGSGKLSDKAKSTLTEMVDIQKAADEAIKQVNDTLTEMAGTLGTDLQTALVSAFRDGTDAANDFGASVSKILEKIITDQMFNIVFGEKLKELETRMKDSYSQGGDQDITDDIAWFYKSYSSDVTKFNKSLSDAKEKIKAETGLDVLKSTETKTQSTSKGFSVSMDQDTGGAILGRITGLHETGLRIEGGLNASLNMQIENNKIFTEQSNQLLQLCSINVQSMYYLEDINKNTKQLYQINDRLGAIEQNTARL